MSLTKRLSLAIDELRIQMLSTEVLFGFQLESTFKEGFSQFSGLARAIDVVSLTSIVLSLAALIAVPAHHRLVEKGDASRHLLILAGHLAGTALLFLGLTLSADVFIVSENYLGRTVAAWASIAAALFSLIFWFGLAHWKRPTFFPDESLPAHEKPQAQEKIEQMLHEAWVALPGATGILGFQLLVTLAPAFKQLPSEVRSVHFAALGLVIAAITILLAPGSIHRLAFRFRDEMHSYRMGSRLLTIGLGPLAAGVSFDYYVAVGRMLGYGGRAAAFSVAIFFIFVVAWYGWPLARSGRYGGQIT